VRAAIIPSKTVFHRKKRRKPRALGLVSRPVSHSALKRGFLYRVRYLHNGKIIFDIMAQEERKKVSVCSPNNCNEPFCITVLVKIFLLFFYSFPVCDIYTRYSTLRFCQTVIVGSIIYSPNSAKLPLTGRGLIFVDGTCKIFGSRPAISPVTTRHSPPGKSSRVRVRSKRRLTTPTTMSDRRHVRSGR